MSTLTKQNTRSAINTGTFEQSHKNAYSHGLESIYALEVVDANSIRPMSGGSNSKKKDKQNVQEKQPIHDHLQEPQLELDMGEPFRKWIRPFFLKEPVRVLGLSLLAEKTLADHQIHLIGDLIATNLEDLVHLKGIGQGHVDEVQTALQEYIKGRSPDQAYHIDFIAWIRSLFGRADSKKVRVALEPYGLDQWVEVTPAEEMEIRRLTLRARREWTEEIYQQITQSQKSKAVLEDFEHVANVFLKPWMHQREGMALDRELRERLERMAYQPGPAPKALKFLLSVYFDESSPFAHCLEEVEKGVFCHNRHTATLYREVLDKAISYFYLPNGSYKIEELTTLLLREFSAKWQQVPAACIERALRLSPRFRARKGRFGQLIVRLA